MEDGHVLMLVILIIAAFVCSDLFSKTYLLAHGIRWPRFKKPKLEQFDVDLTRIEIYPPSPGWNFSCPEYRYFCKCGTQLTEGPCGGAAVNAVCEKCHINYGNLPGCFVP